MRIVSGKSWLSFDKPPLIYHTNTTSSTSTGPWLAHNLLLLFSLQQDFTVCSEIGFLLFRFIADRSHLKCSSKSQHFQMDMVNLHRYSLPRCEEVQGESKKVGSRNIIVFHELLSLGCINFKNSVPIMKRRS